jgi:hypothetical protein
MAAMTRPSFGVLLQAFFSEHLLTHKRASAHTIAAYRDTFRLLLKFLSTTQGKIPSSIDVADLDAPVILSFLDHLEKGRQNSVRSRNQRLAAIRSLFRYIALRDPESVAITARILSIPLKRADRRLIGYLTRKEIEAILDAPDRAAWIGRRDYAVQWFLARALQCTFMEKVERIGRSLFGPTLHGFSVPGLPKSPVSQTTLRFRTPAKACCPVMVSLTFSLQPSNEPYRSAPACKRNESLRTFSGTQRPCTYSNPE